ncbi:hypothetical protein ACQQ2Q_17995 [Agrobacterium sp. ES01]|uniref:hypothetical protein n=1 Tax=Agrobacterium sp. ES01 TaxID=3420714 RepID=UPI003D0D45DD
MKVVDSLKKYRTSVFHDENIFTLLCWLYQSGPSTLRDILENFSLDEILMRSMVRDLYKDNLLRTKHGERFALTHFAEVILEAVDVDTMVTPFMVDELASEQTARSIKNYISWTKDLESDDRCATVQSLRNLRWFFAAYPDISSFERDKYIWSCVLSPDSRMRSVLRSSIIEPNIVVKTYFSNADDIGDGYFILEAKQFGDRLDANDRYILKRQLDDSDEDETRFSEFRVFNYLASSRRDAALEAACAFERHSSPNSSWASSLKLVLKRLSSKLDASLILELLGFEGGDKNPVGSLEEALMKACIAKQERSRPGSTMSRVASLQKNDDSDRGVVWRIVATDEDD